MKKVFTLLAACFAAVTGFAQTYLAEPVSGQQYYITIGSSHVGYVTAGDDGAQLTAARATQEAQPKQLWTATKNDDETWTFTATVDGAIWTIYTDASDSRLHAGTEVGENFHQFPFIFHTDDESDSYAGWQMLSEVPENGQAYANIFGGQALGSKYGPWTDGDNGSKVYFVEPSSVEIPTWNYDFKNFDAKDNGTRYFIKFNRDRTTNGSQDGGPKGIGGLTGNYLVLSCNADTLVADSVIAGDANFAHKIWHVNSYDAETHQISLQNEAGEYIIYKTLDAVVPKGNLMFTTNAETGEFVRTGNSGGGDLSAAWMVTKNAAEATPLYVFKSNEGSECYAIGDSEESTGETFINAWGNVGWHHFMGKWTVDDQNCALKFVPITDVLSETEIPAIPTTGISTISTVKKTTTDGTVYTIDGRVAGKSLNGLAKGLYIVGGKKVVK